MDLPGTVVLSGILGILGRLDPGEFQEMVVDGALLAIEEDFLGPQDLAEFLAGTGIAGIEIGMSSFNRLTEGGPQTLGVVAR